MSYEDLSAGAGTGSGPSSDIPKNKPEENISRGDLGTSAPWEALRPVEPKPDEPKPPSRLGKFFRKALRWVTGLIVVFGLGVGTTWFVRVRPMNYQIDDLKNQLRAAEITVSQLEEQISDYASLINERDELQSENDQLRVDLSETQLHVDLMRVLVDVTSAELALANEDEITAKASLTGTDERLADLQETLQGEDQQTIEGMRTRLALVLEELETDAFAALSDLDVLANNLLALERALFGN